MVLLASIWGSYTLYHVFFVKKSLTTPVKQQIIQPSFVPSSPDQVTSLAQVKQNKVIVIYSTRYRIAGLISYDGKLKVYVQDTTSPHLRIFDQTQCRTGDFNTTECNIDGELVNIHTGTREDDKTSNMLDIVPTLASAYK
jgi:hypothetical protein